MAVDAVVEIAEAVKDALNDSTFSLPFVASRAYDLTAELEDDGVLHVDVGIRSLEGDLATRSTLEVEAEIDVVVRKKFAGAITVEQLDALMALMVEIRDRFLAKRLDTATLGEAWCASYSRKPAYFQSHLRQYRQFTAPLTLTFSIDESLS